MLMADGGTQKRQNPPSYTGSIYIYIYIYIYMFNEGKEHDQLRIILGNNHHNNNHNNILLPFKRERERQNTLER
jgi:hypothetical protein